MEIKTAQQSLLAFRRQTLGRKEGRKGFIRKKYLSAAFKWEAGEKESFHSRQLHFLLFFFSEFSQGGWLGFAVCTGPLDRAKCFQSVQSGGDGGCYLLPGYGGSYWPVQLGLWGAEVMCICEIDPFRRLLSSS